MLAISAIITLAMIVGEDKGVADGADDLCDEHVHDEIDVGDVGDNVDGMRGDHVGGDVDDCDVGGDGVDVGVGDNHVE